MGPSRDFIDLNWTLVQRIFGEKVTHFGGTPLYALTCEAPQEKWITEEQARFVMSPIHAEVFRNEINTFLRRIMWRNFYNMSTINELGLFYWMQLYVQWLFFLFVCFFFVEVLFFCFLFMVIFGTQI